jgi:AraC-like DNA-binding protein
MRQVGLPEFLTVGYDSPSAFIAAFSNALGTTPGRYYKTSEGEKRRG